ncbi:MAG: DUF3822 family protein [Flavipsychrobacter sp.]|nr:DUF3822 family protein [Flavipsychrobacter sp.]
MTEASNTTSSSRQAYNVHNGDSLLSQVTRVICVLMPRALAVAGFSDKGDLLTIRYNDYKKSLPPYILDFFEHQFINEPLLSAPHKITAAYIAGDKSMIVPDVLYNAEASEKWMKQLQFVETNEVITPYHLADDKAQYIFAWPAAVKSLISRYFAKAAELPFAAYQFYKPLKAEHQIICTVTPDCAYATLYHNKALLWHQAFAYENAEDIAFRLQLLCREQDIDPARANLQCTGISKSHNRIIQGLSQYFPQLKDGNANSNDTGWSSPIYLFQQLYACAL